MKKSIIGLLLITTMPVLSLGQQLAPKFVYCEIVGTEKLLSTKVTIQVDFGQRMKFFADNRMKEILANLLSSIL